MNRWAWAGAAGLVVAAIGGLALALRVPPGRLPVNPAVTVLSSPGDPRLPVVREVVHHWNETLAEIGTPLRLGPITEVPGTLPDDDLVAISERMLAGGGPSPIPPSVAEHPGDLLVVLSNAEFISFATWGPEDDGRAMVAIKHHGAWPLTLPNVLPNVVAHEIGHALGLRHNRDDTLLMCGRPAPCRPDHYTSDTPRLFPLSHRERRLLGGMYEAAQR